MRSASRSASLGTPCSASRRAAVQAIASGSVSIKDANLRQAAHLIIREPGKVHITIFHNVGNLHNRAHAFGAIRVDSDKADSFEPPTCPLYPTARWVQHLRQPRPFFPGR